MNAVVEVRRWSFTASVGTQRLATEVGEFPRFRVPYPPEHRRQMVELVRSGQTSQNLAREFEPYAQSIAHWVRKPSAMPASARIATRPVPSARR